MQEGSSFLDVTSGHICIQWIKSPHCSPGTSTPTVVPSLSVIQITAVSNKILSWEMLWVYMACSLHQRKNTPPYLSLHSWMLQRSSCSSLVNWKVQATSNCRESSRTAIVWQGVLVVSGLTGSSCSKTLEMERLSQLQSSEKLVFSEG